MSTSEGNVALSDVAIAQLHLLAAQKCLEETDDTIPDCKVHCIAEVERCKRILSLKKRREIQDEWLKQSQESGFHILRGLSEAKAKLATRLENLAQIEAANAGKLYIPGGLAFSLGAEIAGFVAEFRIANPVSPLKARMKVLEAQNEVAKQEEVLEAYQKGLLRYTESTEMKFDKLGHSDSKCQGGVEGISSGSLQIEVIDGYEEDIDDEGDGWGSCYWRWDEDNEDDEGDTKMGNST